MEDQQKATKVTLYLTSDLHRQLKIRSAVDGEPMSSLAEKALQFYLSNSDVVEEVSKHGSTYKTYSCPSCSDAVVVRDGELKESGWYVGDTAPGEWLEYQNVQLGEGDYRITLRASTDAPDLKVKLQMPGLDWVTLPDTGGEIELFHLGTARLDEAGVHDLRLLLDAEGLNVDWFHVRRVDSENVNNGGVDDSSNSAPAQPVDAFAGFPVSRLDWNGMIAHKHDHDPNINQEELGAYIRQDLELSISDEQLNTLFSALDRNGSGNIRQPELEAFLRQY